MFTLSDQFDDEDAQAKSPLVVATQGEIESALRLAYGNRVTLARLMRAAQWVLASTAVLKTVCTADDLLQTAVVALLSGRRTWDRSRLDFVGLVLGTLRSLAYSNERILRYTTIQITSIGEVDPQGAGNDDGDAIERQPSEGLTPEEAFSAVQRELEFQEAVEALRLLWPVGDAARDILEHLLVGKDKREARALMGLEERDFWSADRRLTRAIAELARTRSHS